MEPPDNKWLFPNEPPVVVINDCFLLKEPAGNKLILPVNPPGNKDNSSPKLNKNNWQDSIEIFYWSGNRDPRLSLLFVNHGADTKCMLFRL